MVRYDLWRYIELDRYEEDEVIATFDNIEDAVTREDDTERVRELLEDLNITFYLRINLDDATDEEVRTEAKRWIGEGYFGMSIDETDVEFLKDELAQERCFGWALKNRDV